MTDKKLGYFNSRRSFIKNSIKYCLPSAVALSSFLTQAKCKKTPTVPEIPITVSGNIIYFNHTQGEITRIPYSGLSGENKSVSVSDINNFPRTSRNLNQNVGDVDSSRIAVRYADNGQNMGTLASFSTTGGTRIALPSQSMDMHVFLMNENQHYGKIDDEVAQGGGHLRYPANVTWHREDIDGVTGPEQPITDAMTDLNNALNPFGIKYGNFTKVNSYGDLAVGYHNQKSPGFRSLDWVGAKHNLKPIGMLMMFITEIFENVTMTANIAGTNTHDIINDFTTGHLNNDGRDLLAYVYAKDTKTPS